jgi:MoaA/NifB/PqqE/SkfB family radical SAM enzyme
VEKYNAGHPKAPSTAGIKKMIHREAGKDYDMLSFCSGEPTIQKDTLGLILYAKKYGFQKFQIVSNFRALKDLRLVLKFLKAGVRNFDISFHAYDRQSAEQIDRINDGGRSFDETLAGLKNLYAGARYFNTEVFVTHKIVANRYNYRQLDQIFRLTNSFGVREYILQPILVEGFPPGLVRESVVPPAQVLPYAKKFLDVAEKGRAKVKLFNYNFPTLAKHPALHREKNLIHEFSHAHSSKCTRPSE